MIQYGELLVLVLSVYVRTSDDPVFVMEEREVASNIGQRVKS